jgi:hypothetical protein
MPATERNQGILMDSRLSPGKYVKGLATVAFFTAGYYLVGMLPEQYHWRKGQAWAEVRAYQWAAWHFRKYLKYSDDWYGRCALGSCYANLGMMASAARQFRVAYEQKKTVETGCYLADLEYRLGNIAAAAAIVTELSSRRAEMSADLAGLLTSLEEGVRNADLSAVKTTLSVDAEQGFEDPLRPPAPLYSAALGIAIAIGLTLVLHVALLPEIIGIAVGLRMRRSRDWYYGLVYGMTVAAATYLTATLIWSFPLGGAVWLLGLSVVMLICGGVGSVINLLLARKDRDVQQTS